MTPPPKQENATYLSKIENRSRHGLGKVYRNSLYKKKYKTLNIFKECEMIKKTLFRQMYLEKLLAKVVVSY